MITCIVFDFDGTLVDSNRIKRDCFFDVVTGIPDGHRIMESVLADPNAGDRYAVFARFAVQAGLQADQENQLAHDYSQRSQALVVKCPEMPGATNALQAFRSQGFGLYINSATPQDDLLPIVRMRELDAAVDGAFGTPATKAENLRHICEVTGNRPYELLVIGDGDNDYKAARDVGCDFVPVFAAPSSTTAEMNALTDLSLLPDLVAGLNAGVTTDIRS